MKKHKNEPSELEFDLIAIREVKRLMNRTIRKVVQIEKGIKKHLILQREDWRETRKRQRHAKREKLIAPMQSTEHAPLTAGSVE